jgi:hypothetical protein
LALALPWALATCKLALYFSKASFSSPFTVRCAYLHSPSDRGQAPRFQR